MTLADARISSTVPLVPLIASAAVSLRLPVGPGIPLGLVVALMIIPMWFASIRRFRWMSAWMALGLLAAVSGVVISIVQTSREVDPALLAGETATMLAMLATVGVLLWARELLGSSRWVMVAFGVGLLANTVLNGLDTPNPWKYQLVVPVAIVLLGVAWTRPVVELICLGALAGVSVLNDSRSAAGFFLAAAVVRLWQFRRRGATRSNAWITVLALIVLAGALYSTVQALILDGAFGEGTRARSEAQIQGSGSLLTGGRPELGASAALIHQNPWGYGSGVLPTANDVWVAKAGMSRLNYAPNNGYVENYLFGGQFEVHSVIGDLWIRDGLAGAAFAMLSVVLCVWGVATLISQRQASALAVYLTALAVWDALFSPFLTSYRTTAAALAITAVPIIVRSLSESMSERRGRRESSAPPGLEHPPLEERLR